MAEHAAVDEQWRIPDGLWERIEPLLPPERAHPKGGRPWMPARKAMDAIFYVLRTGCQWKALPRSIGAGSTVHDRFQAWREVGVFRDLWKAGLLEFEAKIGLDWEWQAMDGAMTQVPLGGERNRRQSEGVFVNRKVGPDHSSKSAHASVLGRARRTQLGNVHLGTCDLGDVEQREKRRPGRWKGRCP